LIACCSTLVIMINSRGERGSSRNPLFVSIHFLGIL
jgi:hypothetical protein